MNFYSAYYALDGIYQSMIYSKFIPQKTSLLLKEEEQLVSAASDRTPRLKHAKLNLDAFCLVSLKRVDYPSFAEKALLATSVAVFNFLASSCTC